MPAASLTVGAEKGVSLHVLQEGEGPDLLWIPGGDQTAADWYEQFAAFSREYRCTSFDPRGAGQTVCDAPMPWTIGDMARDAVAVIKAVCEPPVVAIGLSMGALIVQELGVAWPADVRLGIAMGSRVGQSAYMREWEGAQVRFSAGGGQLPDDYALIHHALQMYPAEVFGDDELWAKVKPFVARAYADTGRDPAHLAAQWQACLDYNAAPRLANFAPPLHVLGFSHDVQTPPELGRRLADAVPRGHFHLLDGLAHCSMFGHRPEVVSACIRSILQQEGLVGRQPAARL